MIPSAAPSTSNYARDTIPDPIPMPQGAVHGGRERVTAPRHPRAVMAKRPYENAEHFAIGWSYHRFRTTDSLTSYSDDAIGLSGSRAYRCSHFAEAIPPTPSAATNRSKATVFREVNYEQSDTFKVLRVSSCRGAAGSRRVGLESTELCFCQRALRP